MTLEDTATRDELLHTDNTVPKIMRGKLHTTDSKSSRLDSEAHTCHIATSLNLLAHIINFDVEDEVRSIVCQSPGCIEVSLIIRVYQSLSAPGSHRW